MQRALPYFINDPKIEGEKAQVLRHYIISASH
jgi:hypothetical protein